MNCILCQNSNTVELPPIDDLSKGILARKVYFECTHCGVRFLTPAQRLSFQLEKGRYQEHNNDLLDQRYLNYLNRLWNFVEENKDEAKGLDEVLDYGCGPVRGFEKILKGRARVSSYDPYFFKAEEVLKKNHYDCILVSEAAEHFYRPIEEFQRLRSFLQNKGYLAIRTELLSESLDFENWWYRKDPTHVVFYAPKSFVYLANNLSMDLVKLEKNLILLKASVEF